MLVYPQFGETLLQDFKISHELVFEFGLPVDFAQWQLARIEHIGELAIDNPCTQLLDLGQVALHQLVDPAQQFPPRHVDSVTRVDCDLVYHFFPLTVKYNLKIAHSNQSQQFHLLPLHTSRKRFLANWTSVFVSQPVKNALLMVGVPAGELDDHLLQLQLALTNGTTLL